MSFKSKYSARIQTMIHKFLKDNVIYYAATTSFFWILCLFPFLLILMGLIRYIPSLNESAIIMTIQTVAPEQVEGILSALISDVYENTSFTVTSISAIGTIWAAGQGFMSIMYCFDGIYEVEANRKWLIRRMISTFYTFLVMLVIVFFSTIQVFGHNLVNAVSPYAPVLANILDGFFIRRMLIYPCLLLIIFTTMYMLVPNHKSSIASELPGAVIATIGWTVFSYLYSLIVRHSASFSYMYGSMATLIFGMFWIYFCFVFIFFGAEFNMYLKMHLIVLPGKLKKIQKKLEKRKIEK